MLGRTKEHNNESKNVLLSRGWKLNFTVRLVGNGIVLFGGGP